MALDVTVLAQDNYPKMDLTLLDLSPYYLLEARNNLKYWADKRAKGEALGGADGTGSNFLQAPAEAIPQPDASFDVVRWPPLRMDYDRTLPYSHHCSLLSGGVACACTCK